MMSAGFQSRTMRRIAPASARSSSARPVLRTSPTADSNGASSHPTWPSRPVSRILNSGGGAQRLADRCRDRLLVGFGEVGAHRQAEDFARELLRHGERLALVLRGIGRLLVQRQWIVHGGRDAARFELAFEA